jgi:hypothetical protein
LPSALARPDEAPVRGFDVPAYEISYLRAEREIDAEGWLREARYVGAAASARWERDASALYDDRDSMASARSALDSWTESDMAERFSAWLRDRFFGRSAAALREKVSRATEAANIDYLYTTNPDGSVRYDEAGDPRYAVGSSLADDRAAWNSMATSATSAALVAFSSGLETLRPELLALVPEEERARYEGLIGEASESVRVRFATELDALVARDERLFVARRTADVWSLRNGSESEAAAAIAAALVEEAGAACGAGLSALSARIEAFVASVDDPDAVGSGWLEEFSLQFDRGLLAWQGAEERFMVRRLEWERDAEASFDAGNEAWASAYERLSRESRAWEAEAGELLREGEESFGRAGAALEADIKRARAEFERDANERATASATRAGAWVDVYLQSCYAATSAREGADYWLSLLGDDAPSFGDAAIGAWLDAEESAGDSPPDRSGTIARLRDCMSVYDEFSKKALDARDRLVADFGLALGAGAGSLTDVLEPGISSDDFYLDEYQEELLRAKAMEGYWIKRAWIAEAVLEYAADLSSGRSTEGESMRLLKEASEQYSDALSAYGSAREALSGLGGALGEAGRAMDAARDALIEASSALEATNSAYAMAMAALVSEGDGVLIRDELYAQYRRLIVYSGLSAADGAPSEAGLVAAYLAKARALGYAEDIERSGEALREAVNGLPGELSLYELSRKYERIVVPADPAASRLDVDAYGLDADDPSYSTIEALLRDMSRRIAEEDGQDGIGRIESAYRSAVAAVAERARIQAAEALASRLDGIALLGSTNAGDWYAARSDGRDGGGDTRSRLDTDLDVARRSLLGARAALELEAIRYLLGDYPASTGSDDSVCLADSLFGEDAFEGRSGLESARASLEILVAAIEAHADSGAIEFSEAIEDIAGSDASIATFARGRGFFAIAACDVASLYLVEETAALEKARGRSAAFSRYGSSSVASGRERVAAVSALLGDALAALGLSIDDGGLLPDADELVEAILGRSGSEIPALADLFVAVDAASSLAPAWIASELSGWRDAIMAQASALGAAAGIGDPRVSATYEATLAEYDQRASVLSAVLSGLSGSEYEVALALRLSVSAIDWSDTERMLIEEETERLIAGNGEGPIDDTYSRADAEKIAATYAGEYSGETLRWAARTCGGDARLAIGVARLLEAGGMSDPFHRWIMGAVSDKAVALMAETRRLAALIACSRSFERAGNRARDADAAGEKHWREYLPSDTGSLPDGLPPSSSSWAEGVSADAREDSHRRSASLTEALRAWGDYVDGYDSSDGDSAGLSDFGAIARRYIDNPELLFDSADIAYAPNLLAYGYDEAVGEYCSLAYGREKAREAIATLGYAYESLTDPGGIQERLSILASEIIEGDARYDRALAAYAAASDAFEAVGAAYDRAYDGASASYRSLDEARTIFEKEDAIRRWASTAYLSSSGDGDEPGITGYRSPAEELALAKASSARASAALSVLGDLYSGGERERPYDDPEYASMYVRYKDGYRSMMMAAKARDSIAEALKNEARINAAAYGAFRDSRSFLERGAPDDAFGEYLTIDPNGSLRLAYGSGFSFQEGSGSESVSAYFSESVRDPESGRVDSTAFHIALDELCAWMGSIDFSTAKARQWGLARDYVLGNLVANDTEFAGIIDYRETGIDKSLLGSGRFVLLGKPISEILEEYRNGELATRKRLAYESMGAEEKGWFENYLALRISGALVEPIADAEGGESTYDGFSYWSSRSEYEKLEAEAERELRICENGIKVSAGVYAGALVSAAAASASLFLAFLAPGFLVTASVAYAAMAAFGLSIGGIQATQGVYAAEMRDLVSQTDAAAAVMTRGMSESARLKEAYLASCARMDVLAGTISDDEGWDPSALSDALVAAGWSDGSDLKAVTDGYSTFALETGAKPKNASEALTDFAAWSQALRDDARDALERAYADDESARLASVSSYREVYGRYIEGEAGDRDLAAAARAAYGDSAASMKSHLSGIADIVEAVWFKDDSCRSNAERSEAASLYGSLVQRVVANRLSAEFDARSAEWEIAREALRERRVAWREAGTLILSRGRADFKRGAALIQERANEWSERFGSGYTTRNAAWDCASADMLERKLSWVSRATIAAGETSSEAMLALVGSDAESAARRMDTVFVSAIDFADGASAAYDDVMAMAGIAGMSEALDARAYSIASSSGTIRSGISGSAAWTSGRIRVAAADYAERANRRLAGIQAAMMAANARETAAAAIAGLEDSIRAANASFNGDMNRTFVADGKWRRSGDSYVKDVVVHSTVVDPYITESARVKAYAYFVLGAWSLETDLSDSALEKLDSLGIRALIARAQGEVAGKSEAAFGGGDGSEFGAWIGRAPILADGADPDDGQASMFSDLGSGELGRLVSAYLFWAMKEGKGWSEARKPLYEKDLWDDRGDWFQAPSIRGISDIGVGVAAMALSGGTALPALLGAAAINLADDFVFGALDGIGGYKSLGEAGLDFGKKALGSAASVAGSGLFFGYGGQAGGFFQKGLSAGLSGTSGIVEVVGRAGLSGLHAATTAVASSALDGLYWKDGGLGWSGSSFVSGLERGLVGTAAAMTGSLASGSLGLIDLVDGNGITLSDEVFDTTGIRRFNALAGGLVGGAVSRAFTGDFTVNVLNASGLTGGSSSGGLLELHMGGNGMSMNLGTSGADVSLGSIGASLSGLVDATRVAAAKGGALFGAYEDVSTLNAVNMLGYAGDGYAAYLARNIWKGGIEAVYHDDLDAGEGEYGVYDMYESPLAIGLSSDLLGSGKEKAALLASVMAHEGTHAGGNRVEAAAIIEHLVTYSNLSAMFGLEMDGGFVDGSLAGLADGSSWTENTGRIDNLRVRLDGSIYDDDDNGVVSFEDGRSSIALGTGLGKQGALEAWLGMSGVKDFNAYVALIKASGNRLVDGKWSDALEISRAVVDLAYKNGRLSEEQYRSIVGDLRTDAGIAVEEQRGLRVYKAVLEARAKLADMVAGNLFVPGEIAFGSGTVGDPYIFTGQGGLSQLDFSAASEGRYDEVGPCYLMANSVPFLFMGATKEAVYAALLRLGDGIVEPNTAAFNKDSPVFWQYMQEELKTTGAVSWYGGSRQEMGWDAFASSGASMGLLWMDNPKREDESQHWGFVYKVDDSWYFQDPWNPSEQGVFETWGIESWEIIEDLSIRPIQISIP